FSSSWADTARVWNMSTTSPSVRSARGFHVRMRLGDVAARYVDMTQVFCNDAVQRIESRAKNTLAAMSEGDELRTLLAALRRFTKMTPMNTVAARQRIANVMIEANKYVY